jgi:hypothetical protein
MITAPASVTNAKQWVATDTRDTVLEEDHHPDKTRKPKNNMNQPMMMAEPLCNTKENRTYLMNKKIKDESSHID